jgi:hypothetical protein
LKAPAHLPGLRALFATYPDANVIILHRDPLEVVASVASLHVTLRRTFSDAVDPLAVGPEVTSMIAEDIRRGFAARDAGCAPAERFVDVWYAQLLHKPLDVVRRIYRQFDLPLKPRRGRCAGPGRNLKDHYGPHVYSLAQFGSIMRSNAAFTRTAGGTRET